MNITLVGMSNIGKSYHSEKFANKYRLERIDCDFLIEQKLKPNLEKEDLKGLSGLTKWMGQPGDIRYFENSRKYKAYERTVMLGIIDKLRTSNRGHVIDTSGSIVYVDKSTIEKLKEVSTIIYLAPPDDVGELIVRFKENPKPVIWETFPDPHTLHDDFEGCYKKLLQSRAKLYEAMADYTIPYCIHSNKERPLRFNGTPFKVPQFSL